MQLSAFPLLLLLLSSSHQTAGASKKGSKSTDWRHDGGNHVIRTSPHGSTNQIPLGTDTQSGTPIPHHRTNRPGDISSLRDILSVSLHNKDKPGHAIHNGKTNASTRMTTTSSSSYKNGYLDDDSDEDAVPPPKQDDYRLFGQAKHTNQVHQSATAHVYREEDDDDYCAQFENGFQDEGEEPERVAVQIEPKNNANQDGIEDESDEEEENEEEALSASTSAELIASAKTEKQLFHMDGFNSHNSSSTSASNSLYSSTIHEAQGTLLCKQNAVIYSDYGSSSRDNTPKSPGLLSPMNQSTHFGTSPLNSSQSPSRGSTMSTSRSPRKGYDWPSSPKASIDSPIQRFATPSSTSSTSSNSPSTPQAGTKKRPLIRRSQASSGSGSTSLDILDRHSGSAENDEKFYCTDKSGTNPLLLSSDVQRQIKKLQKRQESAQLASEVHDESVINEFEVVGEDHLRPYVADLKENFTDKCLDWYQNARQRTFVIPNMDESCIDIASDLKKEHKLCDGAAPWFEPHNAFRHKHRIFAIHAIGPCYWIDKVEVIPVVLRTGQVVGFWRLSDESPWPRWRPVLGIRLTQSFPFHNSAADLAKEGGFVADIPIKSHYYQDTSSDIFLERASLELYSFKDTFPAYVEMKDFRQLAHFVGWRMSEAEVCRCNNLTMELEESVLPLYTSYQTQRSVFVQDKLFPKQIITITSSYQGQYLGSFPTFFNIPASLNHLLLIPGGFRGWADTIGSQETFQILFGPLISWLIDPVGFPVAYEPLLNVEQQLSMRSSKSPSAKIFTIQQFRDSLSIGQASPIEVPSDSLPQRSLTTRPFSPISHLQLPKKVVIIDKESAPKIPLNQSHRSSFPFYTLIAPTPVQPKRTDTKGPYQPAVPISHLTKHNPLVDLFALEDQINAFQDACMAEQLSACAGAEILFFRLVYRCCCIIAAPASTWVDPAHLKEAERNLTKIRLHLLNQINSVLGHSQIYKWSIYTTFDLLGPGELFHIYYRMVTSDI